jgi:hypothetical protein
VANTFVFEDKEIWFFMYAHFATRSSLRIYGTPNHPVWVKNKGWMSIESLTVGDEVEFEDDSEGIVANVGPVISTLAGKDIGFVSWQQDSNDCGHNVDFSDGCKAVDEGGYSSDTNKYFRRRVYNIEVEDFHTFYVGAQGVWVHNITCAERVKLGIPQTFTVELHTKKGAGLSLSHCHIKIGAP